MLCLIILCTYYTFIYILYSLLNIVVTLYNKLCAVPVICNTYLTFLYNFASNYSHYDDSMISFLSLLSLDAVGAIKSLSSTIIVILINSSYFDIY